MGRWRRWPPLTMAPAPPAAVASGTTLATRAFVSARTRAAPPNCGGRPPAVAEQPGDPLRLEDDPNIHPRADGTIPDRW